MTPKLPVSKISRTHAIKHSAKRPGEPSREGSMRRVLGTTLTGLGAFFLVLALLLRFVLPGQVVKWPLNEYQKTTLTGHGVSYFSQKDLKEENGVTAEATSTVEGDVAAGTSSMAVWNEFTAVEGVTNRDPIQYVSQPPAAPRPFSPTLHSLL